VNREFDGQERLMKRKRNITIRLGPLALSLVAAVITAIGFAAVSLADSGSGTNASNGSGTQTFQMPAPPGGAGVHVFGPNLSAADRKKMDEFHQCMQANGAPGPPNIDPSSGPPKPPSAADQAKIQKAFDACKDKLPEGMQNAGPPRVGTFNCGPPPGTPPKSQNRDQSNQSGTSSSGSSS
jgi:hypothetical protein